jgi:uncharacterized protein (DUF885 family)
MSRSSISRTRVTALATGAALTLALAHAATAEMAASAPAGAPPTAAAATPAGIAPSAAARVAAASTRVAEPSAAARELATVVEAYWQRQLELNPLQATFNGEHRYDDRLPNYIGEAWLAEALAVEKEYLQKIEAIDPAKLQGQDRLTWDIFRRDRREEIDGYRFQDELLPINQFFGLPQVMAQLGSGTSAQPFQTVRDYENWLKRIDGFVVWSNQAITNMRRGADKGIVQPRALMERLVPLLDKLIAASPEQSVFWRPVASFGKGVPAGEQGRLREAYRTAIVEKLNPSLVRLRDFVKTEYMPRARETVAFTALPMGKDWYAHRVKAATTTTLTPDQIHQIGLDEVRRIGAEIDRVARDVGFPGDRRAFFDSLRSDPRFYHENEADLLDGYRALKDRVRARLPELFDVKPKADFEIRAVEPFRAAAQASASYMPPSPDGKRPGVFYVNTYDLKSRPKYSMQAIYLHEAEPGHHYQIAIQQELQGLPKFRRFGGYTAYAEGWGLYAESLGRDLGFYTDAYDYVGALSAEIWRAIRLVADTGLHAKGWTRQQAIDYMLANSAIGATDAAAEIDRYIAIPGQALAYKLGELKIKELKARAQRELGPRYDVRAFHRQILIDGALPLDVLDAKIDRWIQQVKSQPLPAASPANAASATPVTAAPSGAAAAAGADRWIAATKKAG